jgi:hypothetical protein
MIQWTDLPAIARILLIHMALTALDAHQRPKYFGGRDALVEVLYGFTFSDPESRAAQYRIVRKHLAALENAGAIVRLNRPHTRERAEYELILRNTTGWRQQQAAAEAQAEREQMIYDLIQDDQDGLMDDQEMASNTPEEEDQNGPPEEEDQYGPPVENVEDQNGPPVEDQNGPPSGGPKRSGQEDQNGPPKEYEETRTGDTRGDTYSINGDSLDHLRVARAQSDFVASLINLPVGRTLADVKAEREREEKAEPHCAVCGLAESRHFKYVAIPGMHSHRFEAA